jgi:hypothetical protein
MEQIQNLLSNHLGEVLLVLGVIINALNALTPHFSSLGGISRKLGVVLELLSIFKSKDVKGLLKAPFVSVPPEE